MSNKLTDEQIIQKASELLSGLNQAKGHAVVAVMDENGYPSASAVSIEQTTGITELLFSAGISGNKALRIAKNNKGSVCVVVGDSANITLVGTLTVHTDSEMKHKVWDGKWDGMWSGTDDPDYCVISLKTKRYGLWVGDENMLYGEI